MTGTDIICFGEAMVELSAIKDAHCRIAIAGDTFNTAVYLSREGYDVSYVTAVGTCPFSAKLLDALGKEGVGAEYVPALPRRSIGLYAINVDDEGERSFTYWRSESAVRSLFETPEAPAVIKAMETVETLYLTGVTLSLYTPENRGRIFRILEARKESGLRTIFDGNYRPRNWKDMATAREVTARAIALSTWSLPTYDDEAALFSDPSPDETAKRHRGLGAAEVTVKDGPNGALVGGAEWVAPRKTVKPVDTTGAGDSFNAAYIARRLRGGSQAEAAMAGHDLAARVLGVPGALIPRTL